MRPEPPRPQGEERIDYVGFGAEGGEPSRMAVVRKPMPRVVGRYLLGDPIAAGGMATVHLGRLMGPAGFSRTVAVKRLHAHLATNPQFVSRFVDEARIASRVRHTNVVQTLDVVSSDGELLLVLDYVHGESLARLRRLATAAGEAIPPDVASGIVGALLRGLHAAHEARSSKGQPLDLVHRDVTPQNILVGADGVTRVLDFGIAQAAGLSQESLTRDVKGKLAYMPPEQLTGERLDRRTDLFAVGVVLWEVLAGERLFRGDDVTSTIDAIYNRVPPRLSERMLGLSPAVDELLARALSKDARARFESADAMARAVEAAVRPATDRAIAEWVARVGSGVLAERLARVATFESEESGLSSGRLMKAQIALPLAPESGTVRRDAVMPPPLATSEQAYAAELRREQERANDSCTSEAATPKRNPRVPLPTPVPKPRVTEPIVANASAMRPIATPLVMIAATPLPSPPAILAAPPLVGATAATAASASSATVPELPSVFAPSSGHTRVDPIERRVQKRTPLGRGLGIPASRPIALPPPASKLWITMLLLAAPLLVLAAIIGTKPLRARAAPTAAIAVAVPSIEPTPIVAAPPPPLLPRTPMVLAPEAAAPARAAVAAPRPAASARKPARPAKSPKPPPRLPPVAVNR